MIPAEHAKKATGEPTRKYARPTSLAGRGWLAAGASARARSGGTAPKRSALRSIATKAKARTRTNAVAKYCIPSIERTASNVPWTRAARARNSSAFVRLDTSSRPIAYPQIAPKKRWAGTVTKARSVTSDPDRRPIAKYFTFSTAAKPRAAAQP